MPGLSEAVLAQIETHLREREVRREELYQRARRLRRLSQKVMIHIHEGKPVETELTELDHMTRELTAWVDREGHSDEGLARDALQESVEARLLGAVVRRASLPSPQDLCVGPEVYLLGLGDFVGEVRRLALDRLARRDIEGAESYLKFMDSIYRDLLRFDTTRAIVALKPKQDTARALLERTRGEVTMARVLAHPAPAHREERESAR